MNNTEENSTKEEIDWRSYFEDFNEFAFRMINGRDRYGINKIEERIEVNRLFLKKHQSQKE